MEITKLHAYDAANKYRLEKRHRAKYSCLTVSVEGTTPFQMDVSRSICFIAGDDNI